LFINNGWNSKTRSWNALKSCLSTFFFRGLRALFGLEIAIDQVKSHDVLELNRQMTAEFTDKYRDEISKLKETAKQVE